jgi:alkylation response protein AidB-like acyl-CoA dehydrogenase
MRVKGVKHTNEDGVEGWLVNGQKTWTTSAHFAEWYWCGVRTDPNNKHLGISPSRYRDMEDLETQGPHN